VKYTFDWGDGTASTTSLVSSGTTASASHSWTIAPGTRNVFNVSAKATDENGMDSVWSKPQPVIIVAEKENHPPTIPAVPSGPVSCTSGMSYTFSTSSIDPDGDSIKYIFDWGDGSTETGYFPSGQVVTASHSWNIPPGSTRSYNVRALSADSHNMMCPYPYWSEPLLVTIVNSPLISAQKLSFQVEGNEPIYEQNEEVELADTQTEEVDSIDAQTEVADSMDAQTERDCSFAVDDLYSVTSTESELRISAPGVLENDQCGSNKSLSVISYSQPTYAVEFAMNSDGSFTYIIRQDYCGEDSFTYRMSDGDGESNEAKVTIFIDCGLQKEENISD